MTSTAPRTSAPAAPGSRSSRLGALAVPGALLILCSAAVASMAGSHAAIAQTIRLLVTLH